MAVAAMSSAIPALGGFAVAAWAAVAPFLPMAVAIGAVTLAVQQLIKHWDELDFGEAISGLADIFGQDGTLAAIGSVLDPTALLQDIGVIDKAEAPIGGVFKQEGRTDLNIKIDSEGRPTVDKAESETFNMFIGTGLQMSGAG